MVKRILLVLLVTLSLQSCVGAFVAGAAVGGVVVYESRHYKYAKKDHAISKEAQNKLRADQESYKKSRIVLGIYDGVVLIAGQTPSPQYRAQIQSTIESIPNVKRVYNEMTISGPISSMTQSSDAWITTKVKSQLLATKGINSDNIKVITENGMVYLMGKVTKKQADIATAISRRTDGVQKVVTLFEYITIKQT